MLRGDDDLELRPTVNVVDLNQLHQPGFFTFTLHNKTTFTLIVNVLIVEIGQLDKGLIRLFEPVAHHAGIVVELVDKAQVFTLQRTEFNVAGRRHYGATVRPVRRSRHRRVLGSQ